MRGGGVRDRTAPDTHRRTVLPSTPSCSASRVCHPCPNSSRPADFSSSAVIGFMGMDEPQHILAEAVDAGPRAVADPVPRRSDVDHVGVPSRGRAHRIVRLLVGDDDQPVVRQGVDVPHRRAEVGPECGCDRVTASTPAIPRRGGTSTTSSEKVNTLTWPWTMLASAAAASSLERSDRLDSGQSIDPDTSTRTIVLPGSTGIASTAADSASSSAGSNWAPPAPPRRSGTAARCARPAGPGWRRSPAPDRPRSPPCSAGCGAGRDSRAGSRGAAARTSPSCRLRPKGRPPTCPETRASRRRPASTSPPAPRRPASGG